MDLLKLTNQELIDRMRYNLDRYRCLPDPDDVIELLNRFDANQNKLYEAEQIIEHSLDV
jgi:hypothetical protein